MTSVLAPAPTSSITLSPKFQVLTDTSENLGLDGDYSVVIVKQGSYWVSGKIENQVFEYQLTSPDKKGKHKLAGVLIEGLGFKRLGGTSPRIKFNLFARFTHHTREERRICISAGATSTWTLGCLRGLIGLVDNDSLLEPFSLTCSAGDKSGVNLCSVYQYAQPNLLDVDKPELWMTSDAFNDGYHLVKGDKEQLFKFVQNNARIVLDYLVANINSTDGPILEPDDFMEVPVISSEVVGE